MMKDVVRALRTGALAEVALVAFVVAFLLVVIYTFTISKKKREHAKNLPLDDAEAVDPPSNGTSAPGSPSESDDQNHLPT